MSQLRASSTKFSVHYRDLPFIKARKMGLFLFAFTLDFIFMALPI
jgi:hypothetical protein